MAILVMGESGLVEDVGMGSGPVARVGGVLCNERKAVKNVR